MEGNLVGSDEKNIRGETTFSWLPGGFFLEQRGHIDFIGFEVDALELIGYDPETDTFPSTVFSGFAPTPLPYRWDVRGDDVTISVSYGQLDATFTGAWREDGTFAGGWRPNPGADENANPPTTSAGTRSGSRGRDSPAPSANRDAVVCRVRAAGTPQRCSSQPCLRCPTPSRSSCSSR
jgi:hypothetical protein